MRDELRKKYQKKLNKIIKDINASIQYDYLWNGRFVFHIMCTEFERFADGSGGLLHSVIRGYDKKTGVYHDYRIEYMPYNLYNWRIWGISNRFITKDTDTWNPPNNPYKDKADFNHVEVNDKIWNLKYNPYKFY